MTNQNLLSLESIHVSGTATEMGNAHGETLRDAIQAFTDHRIVAAGAYLQQREYPVAADFRIVGQQCLDVLKHWHPEGHAEHCGVAAGANVDAADLYAAANYSDIRDLVLLSHPEFASTVPWDEGCTAIGLPESMTRDSVVLTGQTWDLHPRDMDHVVAIHRLPDDGPESWSVTCTGCPSLMGMNEFGVYVGTTNIKVHGVRPGVGYLSLLHRALNSMDRKTAATMIHDAPRIAAHTYWLGDAGGVIELECTSNKCTQRAMKDDGAIFQTNHCLDNDHAAHESEPPSASSIDRFGRIGDIFGNEQPDDHNVESIQQIFADRAGEGLPINRYPEDDDYAATNSCVIGVPINRELWACRGPSDRGEWIRLPFERAD